MGTFMCCLPFPLFMALADTMVEPLVPNYFLGNARKATYDSLADRVAGYADAMIVEAGSLGFSLYAAEAMVAKYGLGPGIMTFSVTYAALRWLKAGVDTVIRE